MIESGTLLQDRYLIERQIGAGGMGAVYLAVDQRFGSHVAIKETFYKNDQLGEAFEREAHLLNSLLHPVLPHVSDFFTENDGHFLVMQFIEGEDLFEVLKREGAFPAREVLRWTDSLLDALDYLHSHEPPVIHRDIKPQNLKITPRGDVILLDFGLAKLSSEDTLGGLSVFGYSRRYSPLEQIQGTGTDARSDLFALAATAYYLLTGEPPLDALRRASAIIAGNADPLPLASDLNSTIPLGVASVLNSALALNPAQRFVSAKAMRQALEQAVKADLLEEGVSEDLVLPLPIDEAVINSAETENFPALESFADEIKGSPQTDQTVLLPAVENFSPNNVQTSLPAPEFTQANSVVEAQTKISPRSNRSRFPLAAAGAAMLICVTLATGYFINKANSSAQSNETPVIEQQTDAENAQSAPTFDLPKPDVSGAAALPESIKPAEVKSAIVKTAVEKRKTNEKQKTVDEPLTENEMAETPKTESVKLETARPAPVQNKRRSSQPQSSGEVRARVIESQRAPDIESIFTGRPAGERVYEPPQRREERRRQQRDQMTDEELREMRRQRRQQRRERQNNQNFPF